MLYTAARLVLIVLFKILFKLEVWGKKNIPKKGGFILASNHTSYLDSLALGVACQRKLNFMARHDLFCNPWFSWLLSKVGAFPVKRNSADISALKEAMRRVKKGNALVVFPEGSRQFEGLSSEPQAGIGFLVSRLGVPVIPAFISGTDKALPRNAKFIRPKKVSVHFGKPHTFPCDEVLRKHRKVRGKQISIERRMPYQEIAQLIMEDIRHLSCLESN